MTITATGSAGQGGGDGGGSGGNGDVVTGTLSGLTVGQILDVCVDSGGGSGNHASDPGGNGGGASGVALGSDFSNPVLIAGGGGGGGGQQATPPAGPNGGGSAGSSGGLGGIGYTSSQAGGGTQSGYGAGGQSSYGDGGNGSGSTSAGPGAGGSGGGSGSLVGGGGGGGGYYGGGGGGGGGQSPGGGGGGGSDFCASSLTDTNCQAPGTNSNYGAGQTAASVTLSYTAVSTAPAITSASSTTFATDQPGSFKVTTTGAPTPSLSESGALPSGVTFIDNGDGTATLAGTPGMGTEGTYPITITAGNGVSPNASQSFTLTVLRTTTFTSPGCSVFKLPGSASFVRITATGSAGQGSGGAAGGTGAVVSGTLSGAAGQSLYVCIDSGGGNGGSGNGGSGGGNGGGASGVALGSDFSNPVLIGGGGGGGGGPTQEFSSVSDGAAGGSAGPSGGNGSSGNSNGNGGVGGGGAQGAVGAGGSGNGDSSGGLYGWGGNGSQTSSAGPGNGGNGGGTGNAGGGGGGGAGYYGGGGGEGGDPSGGGGGGSDFCASSLTETNCQAPGVNSSYGTASVTLSYPSLPTPSIVTTAQPASAAVGSSIADRATVSGGDSPSGTVTFKLYSSSSTQDSTTLLFTDANEPLTGGVATSNGYTPTATGTDYWVATYNGDSHNTTVSSGAGDEPVTIGKASPSIVTAAQPASAAVGSSIADRATVSGGDSPSGTVTFKLYSSSSTQDSTTLLFTDADEPLTSGVATSNGYAPTATGTDYWVATYNGDTNNNTISSAAGDEPVTIGKASPSIATAAQPTSAEVGSSIADHATVSGGDSPSGTVTFKLYSSATTQDSTTLLFTDADEPLTGGAATSNGYTATTAGTDYWVATYNGDTNNSTVSSGAGDEPVTVAKASPSIATAAQPTSAAVGSSIADQATVSGGDSPSGTVTFKLYSSATTQDSTTLLFTDADEPLTGGAATSNGYTATTAGTDYWVATYNGDTNNSTVSSAAADEPVTITPTGGGGGGSGADQTAPAIDITTPADGASYSQGEAVKADYSCTDGSGSGVASCDGPVSPGSQIDTSATGDHAFTVTAKDQAGNAVTKTVRYTVLAPSAPAPPVPPSAPPASAPPAGAPSGPAEPPASRIIISHRRVPLARGRVHIALRCVGKVTRCSGTLTLKPTHDSSRLRESAAGGARFDIAAGKSKTILVKPTAKLLRMLRKSGKVIVRVTARPTGRTASAAAAERLVTIVLKSRR